MWGMQRNRESSHGKQTVEEEPVKQNSSFRHQVPQLEQTIRIDTYLKKTFPHLTRQKLLQFFREKMISVGKRSARKGENISGGEVLHLPSIFGETELTLKPNKRLKVKILYEDDEILILSKPAGLASCPHFFDEIKTVANFIIAHNPGLKGVGEKTLEPGMLHRLDTETSGVMVVAKTDRSFQILKKQFQAHQVLKEYLALVEGSVVDSGTIKNAIGSHPKNRKKVKVYPKPPVRGTQQAVTHYHVVQKSSERSLLRVIIETGVRHQVRAHLAFLGRPVVGDSLYGKRTKEKRLFLHATKLGFYHPQTKKWVEFEEPSDIVSVGPSEK